MATVDSFSGLGHAKLVGRETELALLLECVDRAARGGSELVLVSGPPGIGKTAVVRAFGQQLTRLQGFLVSGKCGQHAADQPLSALRAALQDLAVQVARKPELARDWAQRLRQQLDGQLPLLVVLVPAMADLVGDQGAPEPVGPEADRRCLAQVIRVALGTLASRDHVLALFLDDLQWVDALSVEILLDLWRNSPGGMLVLGAHRDFEDDAPHPLQQLFAPAEGTDRPEGAGLTRVHIPPLSAFDLRSLLCELFGDDLQDARRLGILCERHSGGNPFHLEQFLLALAAKGMLARDRQAGHWVWDQAGLERLPKSDDIVEIVTMRLRALEEPVVKVLSAAACFGPRFQHADLKHLLKIETGALFSALERAMEAALIQEADFPAHGRVNGSAERGYRFRHDFIEAAAYDLCTAAERQDMHLRIGFYLGASRERGRLLEAAGQLVRGLDRLRSREAREHAIRIFLRAAELSCTLTLWSLASRYARLGMDLLGARGWERQTASMLSFAEVYLDTTHASDPDFDSDAFLADCLPRLAEPVQQARLQRVRCSQLLMEARHPACMELGFRALHGCLPAVTWPENTEVLEEADLEALDQRISARVAALGGDWWRNLPVTTAVDMRVACEVVFDVSVAGFLSGHQRPANYAAMSVLEVILERGVARDVFPPLITYAAYKSSRLEFLAAGDMALQVARDPRFVSGWNAFPACMFAITRSMYFGMRLEHCQSLQEDARRTAARLGFRFYELAITSHLMCTQLARGAPLAALEETDQAASSVAAGERYVAPTISRRVHLEYAAALRAGRPFREAGLLPASWPGPIPSALLAWVGHFRLMTAFWLREHAALPMLTADLDWIRSELCGLPQMLESFFVEAYLLVHAFLPLPAAERRQRLQSAQARLAEASTACPANFAHFRLLLEAEQAWLREDREVAELSLEEAIRHAHRYQNLPYLGLAQERLAQLREAQGDSERAEELVRAAAGAYAAWGCRRRADLVRAFLAR